MQLKVFLLGASGRLGQKIAQKLSKNHIEFVSVLREYTESFDAFQNFIYNACLETKKYILLLDVSLPNVTHNIGNFLVEMMRMRVDHKAQFNDDKSISLKNEFTMKRWTIDGFIVGTTGHSQECRKVLTELSAHLPICLAPNFSKGIFLLSKLLNAQITQKQNFAALAQENSFHISLRDVHHKHKKDAPSGTALWLNQWLKLPSESIESIRIDDVIGEHSIFFATQNETIELSHKVTSREVFADGACDLIIHFFKKQLPSGMYSVSDIWAS